MTAYYFAGRYSRNAELRGYRDELKAKVAGAWVTSRWIDLHADIAGGLEQSFTPEALAADPAGCWAFGQHDLEDLSGADAIVSFTGNGAGGKGGRHIEHGIALSLHELGDVCRDQFRLVLVGPRENIFHCHPATEVYDTWAEFLATEVALVRAELLALAIEDKGGVLGPLEYAGPLGDVYRHAADLIAPEVDYG